MRDNFDTCDVMSSRVTALDSEIWRLKTIGFEMKVVKGLLREIIRRLPEEEHSVVYISDDDKKMEASKPAGHQVAGVNAGSFPAAAHDHWLFSTQGKADATKATGLKGARLIVRPYKGVTDGEMHYDDPFIHSSAVATSSEAAPGVTDGYVRSVTKSMEVTPVMASPLFAENDESAGPSHIDPRLVDLPNLSATISPVHSSRQSPAPYRIGSPLSFEFKASHLHDGLSHVSTANLVLDDSPSPTAPSPTVLPNMRSFDTTEFTFPPPSKMVPPPTSQSGTKAVELPAVNLQPPTPQTDREVNAAGPQSPIIPPNLHDGLSHLSTANLVLDDSPPSTPPSPFVLPDVRSFGTTEFTFPPPSKMAPPPTSQGGTNADELPAVNLRPPTSQTDREVNDPVPQTPIIRPRPIPKRMPAQSSGTADDDANPVAAVLTVPSDSLHPPSEGRMTRSRAHSNGPPSPAGKRKTDDADTGRAYKRRK
jgi:hypothetical protein